MMKRAISCLLTVLLCTYTCFASIADDPETVDGYLTSSEYVNIVELEGIEELFVMGEGQTSSTQEITVILKYNILLPL